MARILWLAIGAIAAALFCLPGTSVAAVTNVSVLYTGDTHGHLKSFFYESTKPVGGVAKRAIFLQDRRQHKKMNWILLDSGDAISGTALSDAFQGFLDIEAMNRLGYDAMGLGVHELDYGQAVLKQRMAEAKFPIVCANLTDANTGKPVAKPYAILERYGIKIAVIGLITGDLASRVAPENMAGLSVADPIDTARSLVPQLRQQADLVFAVTHLGVNEDIRLATQVPGIDLIVGGFSHSELQEGIEAMDSLIVHDGVYGRSVGQIKMSFNTTPEGGLKRHFYKNTLEVMDGRFAENTNYNEWLASYMPQFQEKMGTLVGNSAMRMDDKKVASTEIPLGNFICDSLRESVGADASILPAAFFCNPMPEGVVTLGDLYAVMPYDHFAVILNVTGAELQDILNEAADMIGQPGYPQVSGLAMGLFNGNAYQVRIGDQPIDPFARYKLATSDALADGALGYAVMGTIKDRTYSGRLVREIVRHRMASGTVASATVERRVQLFASVPEEIPAAAPSSETPPEEPAETAAATPEETPAETSPAATPDEPATTPAGETPAETPENTSTGLDELRYDRTGEPMTDEPVIKDEVIRDSGSELPTAEQPEPTPPAAEPAVETPPAEPAATQPSSAMGRELGRAEKVVGTLQYEFYLIQNDTDYTFHLDVKNTGTTPVQLDFLTEERFDFQVFSGVDLRWNCNFPKFFVQSGGAETIDPGETLAYRESWDGLDNQRNPIPAQDLQCVAVYTISGAPIQLSFNATIKR